MCANHAAAPQNDLLLRLQSVAGCAYMSDLHLPIFQRPVREAVLGIEAAEYPLEAWCAALHYVIGRDEAFADAEEARTELLAQLDQSNA